MNSSPWKTALIDIDVDAKVSAEVDLGNIYQKLVVLIPTLTGGTVTIHVSNTPGGTYYPIYHLKANTGDATQNTTSAATSHMVVFDIGGAQYIKVVCGTTQTTTDKTFLVKGVNP